MFIIFNNLIEIQSKTIQYLADTVKHCPSGFNAPLVHSQKDDNYIKKNI